MAGADQRPVSTCAFDVMWCSYCATESLQVTGHHLDLTAIFVGLLLGLTQGLCISTGCICQVSKLHEKTNSETSHLCFVHYLIQYTFFIFTVNLDKIATYFHNLLLYRICFVRDKTCSHLGSVPLLSLLHI